MTGTEYQLVPNNLRLSTRENRLHSLVLDHTQSDANITLHVDIRPRMILTLLSSYITTTVSRENQELIYFSILLILNIHCVVI